ncbi:membrane protein [Salinibacterium xinjiangense]|uniref:Integral membrane protein n=1 Tax=Salinibacterium xinjiangense TaxID=386302 RepID=A0A2C8Z374_9MICO|nr:membrane protein [Salinibacterium xinjiangense]SOE58116.1 integral membrane protein [Salinibacterium xinjiangense]
MVTPRSLCGALAIAEAITWTLLITGLILRATAGLDVAVSVGGGIHGFVFLAYGATAVLLAVNQRWSLGVSLLAIGSAVIPFATIPVELWLARTGRLDGGWRVDATHDPRDRSWINRALRAFLQRPRRLVGLIIVAVIVLFIVLLSLGPPQLDQAAHHPLMGTGAHREPAVTPPIVDSTYQLDNS